MNGYDYDGVLTAGIVPEEPYVVVSGRTMAEGVPSLNGATVYIRGEGEVGDRVAAAQFKAAKITELGITRFWEDDPIQAGIILDACPDVVVVLVGR